MRRSSLAVHVVLLIVSIVALTALVQAQYGASLEGTITDKSGAVVGGATVTITDQATGVSRNSVTGSRGVDDVVGLGQRDREVVGFSLTLIQGDALTTARNQDAHGFHVGQ